MKTRTKHAFVPTVNDRQLEKRDVPATFRSLAAFAGPVTSDPSRISYFNPNAATPITDPRAGVTFGGGVLGQTLANVNAYGLNNLRTANANLAQNNRFAFSTTNGTIFMNPGNNAGFNSFPVLSGLAFSGPGAFNNPIFRSGLNGNNNPFGRFVTPGAFSNANGFGGIQINPGPTSVTSGGFGNFNSGVAIGSGGVSTSPFFGM